MKRHLLMDLGASRVRIVHVGRAELRSESSAVMTMAAKPSNVLAVGADADAAIERTPENICVQRPQSAGRIAEPSLVQLQLAFWRMKFCQRTILPMVRLSLTVTVPCGFTEHERQALVDAGHAALFKTVELVDELVAHAAGLDGDVPSDMPIVVVVVGAAYAQAGVVRGDEVLMQRMIHARAARDGAAGDAVTAELRHWVDTTFGLSVGVDQIERLKCGEVHKIVGYSQSEGCFKMVAITDAQIQQAVRPIMVQLAELVEKLIDDGVKSVGESVEESVRRHGVFLTGGGAKLKGLADFLWETVHVPVVLAAEPDATAIRGLQRMEARK